METKLSSGQVGHLCFLCNLTLSPSLTTCRSEEFRIHKTILLNLTFYQSLFSVEPLRLLFQTGQSLSKNYKYFLLVYFYYINIVLKEF